MGQKRARVGCVHARSTRTGLLNKPAPKEREDAATRPALLIFHFPFFASNVKGGSLRWPLMDPSVLVLSRSPMKQHPNAPPLSKRHPHPPSFIVQTYIRGPAPSPRSITHPLAPFQLYYVTQPSQGPPSPLFSLNPIRSRRRCQCRRGGRCPACASRGRTPPVFVCIRVYVCMLVCMVAARSRALDGEKHGTHLVDYAVPVAVRLVCRSKRARAQKMR